MSCLQVPMHFRASEVHFYLWQSSSNALSFIATNGRAVQTVWTALPQTDIVLQTICSVLPPMAE